MCPPDSLTDRGPQPGLRPKNPPLPTQSEVPPAPTEQLYRRAAAGPVTSLRTANATSLPAGSPKPIEPTRLETRLRRDLEAKLGELGPALAEADADRLMKHILAALETQLQEATRQLREAIPDLLQDLAAAPCPEMLAALDAAALSTAEPLLRLLPLLTADDLMALIAAAPGTGAARMVPARPRLSSGDAEALAQAAATTTARTLLASERTAVREATLDVLIAREAGHPEWSAPLVHCPALPPRAARALSGLVAWQMLDVLADCPEVNPALCDELRARLQRRLSGQLPHPFLEPSSEEAVQAAHRLKRAGVLAEAVVLAAGRRGEARLVAAMLSVAAGVPISAVNRAMALRSTKGLLSLIWRGGFSMALAAPVQSLLARVPPDAMLAAAPDGGFPLGVEEMRWHLQFLSRVGR